MKNRRRRWLLVAACLATLLLVLLVANLSLGDKPVDRRVESLYGTDDPQFARSMGALLGPPLVGGNAVHGLVNGVQIFPAMLAAIGEARRTVHFETYIYWEGEVGRRFADALAGRARAGVTVRVLLDAVGSGSIDPDHIAEMERAGVEVRRYNPLRWNTLARFNNRTHRKLLVVDGRIGFTGGVGIADPWGGDAQDPEHWRDSHFRVEGPAAAQMQAAFLDNWIEVTGTVPHGAEVFPPLASAGESRAQVFNSAPGGGAESVQLMYLLSIAAARRTIDLSMSYFVPDSLALEAFVAARRRGVVVRIITPGEHIDAATVRRASRALWGDLLRAGVEIWEYQPTMYHCKVMVVDGVWTSVGSTNFDSRSFSVNDETNLNVYDAAFAAEQAAIFERDLARSRRIDLAAWERRPWTEKLHERAASLLGRQL